VLIGDDDSAAEDGNNNDESVDVEGDEYFLVIDVRVFDFDSFPEADNAIVTGDDIVPIEAEEDANASTG